MVFLGGSAGTESVCSVGDLGLTPGLGRSPGEGNGYPLQYSGLENSKHSVVDEVPKESDTTEWLSLNAFCKMVRHFQAICNLKDSFFTSEAKVTLLTPFTILTDLIKRWERTEETYICPMFITVVFIIAEIGESSMPLKGCMDEEDVYTHTEMLLSHKKHEISLVLTTWMDLEGIMLNEISKKDKYSDFTLR